MAAKSVRKVPLIIGNWKMYKTTFEARAFLETLAPQLGKSQAEVYLAVPFTAIEAAAKQVEKLHAPIVIGAQNMNDASEGAFTGEIAARMLKEAGAQFVILGHSERRKYFNETDELVNKKIKRALSDGLRPVVCVGETGEQHEKGEREKVLKEQLLKSLDGMEEADFKTLVVAYEPVWANGTGKVASPENAESAHLFCRDVLAEVWGKRVAKLVKILYGGSVNGENAAALLAEPDIGGLLVGGASLSPESFLQIINSC